MLSLEQYVEKIKNTNLYDVVEKTPLDHCHNLSAKTGNDVFIKREDLQKVFSFKIRGAFSKISSLSPAEREKGIIASSAGNHAQGVALSGQFFKCKTTIVMPVSSPRIKVDAVKSRGAEVVLHGDSYHDAYEKAQELQKEHDYTFVHPFDDPEVITGQGTIGLEILEQGEKPDYVFLAIGGGGLSAGVGAYIKSLSPDTKIIGVEPYEAASMSESMAKGGVVTLDWVGNFADGVAVSRVGEENFRICQQVLDGIVQVSTDQICSAIKDCFEDIRVLLEPSGALAVAGLKKYVHDKGIENKKLVTVACGANVNFDRLRHVAERAQIGENREVILSVELGENPGALKEFCSCIGNHSITEFNYRYSDRSLARIFVGIAIEDPEDRDHLFADLERNHINFHDLSMNELAKIHIRHMIGGSPKLDIEERLYRFEFPERAGALMEFLNALPSDWNISLFHYRCHGSDRGRVLIGLQIPDYDAYAVNLSLKNIGYTYWEETENQAYRLFL